MEENETVSFEEKLENWKKDYKKTAKKLNIPFSELMLMVFQHELMEINRQLALIHEHFDMNEEKSKKEPKNQSLTL